VVLSCWLAQEGLLTICNSHPVCNSHPTLLLSLLPNLMLPELLLLLGVPWLSSDAVQTEAAQGCSC
jgi:hypothetical protein